MSMNIPLLYQLVSSSPRHLSFFKLMYQQQVGNSFKQKNTNSFMWVVQPWAVPSVCAKRQPVDLKTGSFHTMAIFLWWPVHSALELVLYVYTFGYTKVVAQRCLSLGKSGLSCSQGMSRSTTVWDDLYLSCLSTSNGSQLCFPFWNSSHMDPNLEWWYIWGLEGRAQDPSCYPIGDD